MNVTKQIAELSIEVQNLLNALHAEQPDNETFDQEGMLNGSQFIQEYLDQGEFGVAIEHLLYMIYESDIIYPNELIEEVKEITSKYKIKNPYL